MKDDMTEHWRYAWFKRLCLIAGAMLIAMVITCSQGILLSPWTAVLFPTGLIYSIQVVFGYITGQKSWPAVLINGIGPILFGWLIYLSILFSAIFTKKRTTFVVFYAILVVLLIANVAGCQRMVSMSGSM